MGVCNCSMFCCTLLYIPSNFVIILIRKRELVALLSLSSWCPMIVVWLFLVVPWVCLQFVIVVFPDNTHFLFWMEEDLNYCNKIKNLLPIIIIKKHTDNIPNFSISNTFFKILSTYMTSRFITIFGVLTLSRIRNITISIMLKY